MPSAITHITLPVHIAELMHVYKDTYDKLCQQDRSHQIRQIQILSFSEWLCQQQLSHW